ncbi:glutathione S-transferase 1-like [Haematobia irritans]|uniref:glutathione S-transferase 1-like n=1 Tax=Haematobia irritans TaxID=7368 RepID=UPI003F506C30
MVTKPILYGSLTSPTVNAVVITFKALNVDYELIDVKPIKGDNKKQDYLNKNPTGTIPALETEDHKFIGDSHAIISYVADHYAHGDDDSLYPKDLYQRAKVHQLQHFANSIMFSLCVKPAFAPLFSRQTTEVPEEILRKFDEAYEMMERFLLQHKWAAADHMTIADFSCITCIHAMYHLRKFTAESYPHLMDWYKRMLTTTYVNETFDSDPMKATIQFLYKYVIKD